MASNETAQELIKNVEMALLVFQDYGKGFIKTCKVSPDAYLQMALQLTYYRVSPSFVAN
jgi:carnitine O-palmitoyltransferase 1